MRPAGDRNSNFWDRQKMSLNSITIETFRMLNVKDFLAAIPHTLLKIYMKNMGGSA